MDRKYNGSPQEIFDMRIDLDSVGSGMTPKTKIHNIMGNYTQSNKIMLTPSHSNMGK